MDEAFLAAFSDSDPVTRGADRLLRSQIPGAKDQPHTALNNRTPKQYLAEVRAAAKVA